MYWGLQEPQEIKDFQKFNVTNAGLNFALLLMKEKKSNSLKIPLIIKVHRPISENILTGTFAYLQSIQAKNSHLIPYTITQVFFHHSHLTKPELTKKFFQQTETCELEFLMSEVNWGVYNVERNAIDVQES